MVADLVKLYGPGMSYYLPKTEGSTTNAEDDKKSPDEVCSHPAPEIWERPSKATGY